MNQSHRAALKQVCERILEEWGMMLVDQLGDNGDVFDLKNDYFIAAVDCRGESGGTLVLFAQQPFVDGLARNVLGYDSGEPLTEEQYRDAIVELANVVSGNFLTTAFGDRKVFDLVVPEVTRVKAEEIDVFMDPDALYFAGDGQPLCANFEYRGE